MALPHEKLASSLAKLKILQGDGRRVFQSKELERSDRERLVKNGFLREVIKGWLISSSPGSDNGDTTPWYASFWEFCWRYCTKRFASNWNLSPEQSLQLHAENTVIPSQVIVFAHKGTNNVTNLLFDTAVLDLKQGQKHRPPPLDIVTKDGLRLLTPAAALVKIPEHFFVQAPVAAQIALTASDGTDVVRRLLEGGHAAAASRLTGAFRRIGRTDVADDIQKAMKGAAYDVRETDPFAPQQRLPTIVAGTPPVVGRIQALWDHARAEVITIFPKPPGLPKNTRAYIAAVDEIYKSDAYHSLSIEGYSVTPDLIEKVRAGHWNPDGDPADRSNRDALAARGYFNAFQLVRSAVGEIITGSEPGDVALRTYRDWYRAMFQPSVTAGILKPGALAGYRNHPIYIRGSRHVPPRWEILPDAVETLMDLLQLETEPSVRAVLGHWMMGYIHPFPDGNGRMSRFLMNAMLASGGYPWTVISVSDRLAYMQSLETASVDNDIRPFAEFLAARIEIPLAPEAPKEIEGLKTSAREAESKSRTPQKPKQTTAKRKKKRE